jgi:hypothetical protein
MFSGEVGATLGYMNSNPTEHQHEMIAWNATLTLFNEWGIHYTAFWWRNGGPYRLHNGPPDFIPTETGQILKIKLKT